MLSIELKGGLCNKLFCLFSACEIAIKKNTPFLEPFFGWKSPIHFSEIYDIDYFNEKMKEYNNGKLMMVPYHKKNEYKIIENIKKMDLWEYSEHLLENQRKISKMDKNCMNICVLNALKLNKKNQDRVNSFRRKNKIRKLNTMHIRIENDWQRYSINKTKSMENNEIILIDLDTLINLYKHKESSDIFFTTGENHNMVKDTLKHNNINNCCFFNPKLEYEINAAINFELCCHGNKFIGLSRSTFSNLISLKRHLLNKNNSFIYNFNNQIIERVDKGLHPMADDSITKNVSII